MKEVLGHIIPSPDFKLDAFQDILQTILAEQPTAQGILIVRRNRNVAQGTGALLSPNDWQLGNSLQTNPFLLCIRLLALKVGVESHCGYQILSFLLIRCIMMLVNRGEFYGVKLFGKHC